MENLDKNLGFLLHDVARLMRKRFEQNARELGLTRSQCSVLAHLARHDGIQQGALAELLEVEPITLTRLVDRLEQMGLVARLSHPTDRRVRLLRLTEAAHPKLADIFAVGATTRGEAVEGVSEEDRDRLLDVLSTMKANLIAKCSAAAKDAMDERRASHG